MSYKSPPNRFFLRHVFAAFGIKFLVFTPVSDMFFALRHARRITSETEFLVSRYARINQKTVHFSPKEIFIMSQSET